MKILSIGQSTFRITLSDGTALLTDPWFKNQWFWRAVPPALGPDQIGEVHYLLSSHNHLDHLDNPSLDLAKRHHATVIGSQRVARRAKRRGIDNAIPLKPGDTTDQTAFSVVATPAFHPLARDAIGFLIRAEGKQIYFCGDTRADPRLLACLQAAGPIDLAFLQIACARYFGKDDGLNLETAAALARAVSPAAVVPMHYHGRFKQADPHRLADLLAGSAIKTIVIARGQELEVFT